MIHTRPGTDDLSLILDWLPGFGVILVLGTACEPFLATARAVSGEALEVVTPASPAVATFATLAALQRTRETNPAPLWLDLTAGPDQPEWQAARARILSLLNRSRAWLEQRFGRPLVLQLPAALKANLVEACPDLWTIRQLVIEADG